MQAWFYALSLIPIGEVTAISFLAPLFGTLGAVFLLGEVVRIRRWTALVVGFLGAMIILRPTGAAVGVGQLCALVSAMSVGLTAVLVKQLTARDDPDKIVFLTNVLLMPLSLVPALFVWRWPTLAVLPALLGMGVCAVLGHVSLVRGYAATDASLAMTFEFSKLPFAVGIAYLAFGETIDAWTWVGALIIFASAVYITRREAQLQARSALAGRARQLKLARDCPMTAPGTCRRSNSVALVIAGVPTGVDHAGSISRRRVSRRSRDDCAHRANGENHATRNIGLAPPPARSPWLSTAAPAQAAPLRCAQRTSEPPPVHIAAVRSVHWLRPPLWRHYGPLHCRYGYRDYRPYGTTAMSGSSTRPAVLSSRLAAIATTARRPSPSLARITGVGRRAGPSAGPLFQRADDLAGIHDALGVERALDRAHHVELDRRLVVLELGQPRAADAVLGADGAAKLGDDVVHDAVDARALLREARADPSPAAASGCSACCRRRRGRRRSGGCRDRPPPRRRRRGR